MNIWTNINLFAIANTLQLGGYFKGLDHEWFEQREIPGCPFLMVPSDHLSLLAEFIFINPRGSSTKLMSQRSTNENKNTLPPRGERGDTIQNSSNNNIFRRGLGQESLVDPA